MYILYLDESGNHGEATYFILAGLAVFEREIHWFSQDLDGLQTRYFPEEREPVYFHAAKLRVRAGEQVDAPWDRLTGAQRAELRGKVFEIIRSRRGIAFGCAIEKALAAARREDPYERAFEDLISRFDMFMGRVNRLASAEGREEQRGLIVLAESSYEKTIGLLARRLRDHGTRWGILHNVTDIPLFAPARESRLLQYSDFVSNAIYGRYHAGLTSDFDRIAHKFDQEGNVVHGLAHLTRDYNCSCLACFSRRGRQLTLPTTGP
jgi:uncharacterized protein DUF3800